jgi:hypothetical protein
MRSGERLTRRIFATGANRRESVQHPVPFGCAVSSVGEHHIDTVGVASSILAPRTILKNPDSYQGFFVLEGTRKAAHKDLFSARVPLVENFREGDAEGDATRAGAGLEKSRRGRKKSQRGTRPEPEGAQNLPSLDKVTD